MTANTEQTDIAAGYSVDFFRLTEEDGDNKHAHTIVSVRPSTDDQSLDKLALDDYYNIVMVEVSASMWPYWKSIVNHWNGIMAPLLKDSKRTDIYTFGSEVHWRRSDSFLEYNDMVETGTDVTSAIETIYKNINQCKEINIRIILMTDRHHNEGSVQPEESLAKMTLPIGKNLEVYLVGVGYKFPVTLSVAFRSTFHNGSASCPPLFWVEEVPLVDYSEDHTEMYFPMIPDKQFENEFRKISSEIVNSHFKMNLSMPGKIVPQITETTTKMSLGEFIYYKGDPNDLLEELKVSINGNYIENRSAINVDLEFLVERLFKQWNSVLIQRFNNKETIPHAVFDLMEKCFNSTVKEISGTNIHEDGIRSRILKKKIKSAKLSFDTMMNQSKKIIILKEQYCNEIDLAHAILKTSVQSKYDNTVLRLKGKSSADWKKDLETFKKVYSSIENDIKALPKTEKICNVLSTSLLSDLQDSDFSDVFAMNKPEFLNTLNFTGIPIYAPIKDCAQINPWTLSVKNILLFPFEIISQRVLETWYEAEGLSEHQLKDRSNKEVTLQKDNSNSTFNSVVPIIPAEHCKVLKKLVRTNVFSAGATFCILKNPLILDNNCHLAALACTWLKTIVETTSVTDSPSVSKILEKNTALHNYERPEYMTRRIKEIEATANIYLDRPDVKRYIDALMKTPWEAMITETNTGKDEEKCVIKCESIVKPMFLMNLIRKTKLSQYKIPPKGLIQMVLVEFLGRTITNGQKPMSYMDYCIQDTRSLHEKIDNAHESMNYSASSLLEQYFCPEDLLKNIEKDITLQVNAIAESECMKPHPNMDKMNTLYNCGNAGNVKWEDLKMWAEEMSRLYRIEDQHDYLTEVMIEEIFSPEQVLAYLHHAIKLKKSTERWPGPLDFTFRDETRQEIAQHLRKEIKYFVKQNLLSKVKDRALQLWTQEYLAKHQSLAMPLSRQEIIRKATARGIDVTEETFEKVYKYREKVALCRNCCHVEACPHFLVPDNRFNCHLEVRRMYANYPHKLHVRSSDGHKKISAIVKNIQKSIAENAVLIDTREKLAKSEMEKVFRDLRYKSMPKKSKTIKEFAIRKKYEPKIKRIEPSYADGMTFSLQKIVDELAVIYKDLSK